MIYKDGTDETIERLKKRLNLTGDVYLVGQNYIENLETHKKLIPTSTATTIEEAEAERLVFMQEEAERLAKLAEEAEKERAEREANGEVVDEINAMFSDTTETTESV